MVKVQDKLSKAVECLEYFTTHQWSFKNDNVRNLLQHLSPTDRSTFQFDVSTIEWNEYVERYVLGFREFLFKQSPTSLPVSRKQMSRWVHVARLICFSPETRGVPFVKYKVVLYHLFLFYFYYRLYWLHQLSKVLLVLLMWRFLMAKSQKLRTIWGNFLQMFVRFVRLMPFS